jgi:hypothetical protein
MQKVRSMTTAEIVEQLPNGFHDAFLRELHVDFPRQAVRFVLDFWLATWMRPRKRNARPYVRACFG